MSRGECGVGDFESRRRHTIFFFFLQPVHKPAEIATGTKLAGEMVQEANGSCILLIQARRNLFCSRYVFRRDRGVQHARTLIWSYSELRKTSRCRDRWGESSIKTQSTPE